MSFHKKETEKIELVTRPEEPLRPSEELTEEENPGRSKLPRVRCFTLFHMSVKVDNSMSESRPEPIQV